MEKMLADACDIYGQELFDFDIYYFKPVSPNLVLFLGKTDQVASIIGFNQVRWKNGLDLVDLKKDPNSGSTKKCIL